MKAVHFCIEELVSKEILDEIGEELRAGNFGRDHHRQPSDTVRLRRFDSRSSGAD